MLITKQTMKAIQPHFTEDEWQEIAVLAFTGTTGVVVDDLRLESGLANKFRHQVSLVSGRG